MDHIPLEIHMGLEIKGKLPDKMHCTSLSSERLNNGLNLFARSWRPWVCPMGIFRNLLSLEVAWLWGVCDLSGPAPAIIALVPISSPCTQVCSYQRETDLERMEEMGAGRGGGWIFLSSSFAFQFFSFFSSAFPLLFSSFTSSLFCYLFFPLPPFFLNSLRTEEWIKTGCL